jgi:hypothetical protein
MTYQRHISLLCPTMYFKKKKILPRPTTYKTISPTRILDQHARVSELIDQTTRQWNVELISEIFLEEEAAVIRSLPLSPLPVEDRLI